MNRDPHGLPDWLAAGGIGVRMTDDGWRYSADWLNDDLPEPDEDDGNERMADVHDIRDKKGGRHDDRLAAGIRGRATRARRLPRGAT